MDNPLYSGNGGMTMDEVPSGNTYGGGGAGGHGHGHGGHHMGVNRGGNMGITDGGPIRNDRKFQTIYIFNPSDFLTFLLFIQLTQDTTTPNTSRVSAEACEE